MNEESIDFSLGDERCIRQLNEEINSSYSANMSCSFEYSMDIKTDLLPSEELIKKREKKKRIPEEIK